MTQETRKPKALKELQSHLTDATGAYWTRFGRASRYAMRDSDFWAPVVPPTAPPPTAAKNHEVKNTATTPHAAINKEPKYVAAEERAEVVAAKLATPPRPASSQEVARSGEGSTHTALGIHPDTTHIISPDGTILVASCHSDNSFESSSVSVSLCDLNAGPVLESRSNFDSDGILPYYSSPITQNKEELLHHCHDDWRDALLFGVTACMCTQAGCESKRSAGSKAHAALQQQETQTEPSKQQQEAVQHSTETLEFEDDGPLSLASGSSKQPIIATLADGVLTAASPPSNSKTNELMAAEMSHSDDIIAAKTPITAELEAGVKLGFSWECGCGVDVPVNASLIKSSNVEISRAAFIDVYSTHWLLGSLPTVAVTQEDSNGIDCKICLLPLSDAFGGDLLSKRYHVLKLLQVHQPRFAGNVYSMPCCGCLVHTECIERCMTLRTIRKVCCGCFQELDDGISDDLEDMFSEYEEEFRNLRHEMLGGITDLGAYSVAIPRNVRRRISG